MSPRILGDKDWRGDHLLRWHREKQGTVEQGLSVMKNDRGGVLPCGRFRADAAWWRLNIVAHNILALLNAAIGPMTPAKTRETRGRPAVSPHL